MQLGRHPTQTRLIPPPTQEHNELSRLRLPYALAGAMIFAGFLILRLFFRFGQREELRDYYGDDDDDEDLESQIALPAAHDAQDSFPTPNSSGGVVQRNTMTIDHVGTSSDGTLYYLNGHSRDDPYQTAISSLISLQESTYRPLPSHPVNPTEDVETLRVRAIQQLIQDLHSAQYAARNDPGDSRSRRRVEALHARVMGMALQLQTSAHSTRPPTGALVAEGLTEENPNTPHDQPPPYSDVVSVPLILIHDVED
ncbi:hypothetical protein CPC08DRAFT_711637 [Agrocybe pediades]|nr:hypothetical protein CPC08DRAFT_711637 [Agrocybe pediades]